MVDGESHIESIRRRPAMYVGSTYFFGLIHYLVDAFNLHFERRPTTVAVTVDNRGFQIESDVSLVIEFDQSGAVSPFETFGDSGTARTGIRSGPVLNALSDELVVESISESGRWACRFEKGRRVEVRQDSGASGSNRTTLRFRPDHSILAEQPVSPANLTSYLRRMSYLHQGVRMQLNVGGFESVFHAPQGIVDLFHGVAAPCQYLHEPIHIRADEGELKLELVFAWQSWHENMIWAFVNRGRAVSGGTHEAGLSSALNHLYTKVGLPHSSPREKALRNGVIAVMSLQYPNVVWQGCIKDRIGNPELKPLVRRIVIEKTLEWLKSHPDVAEQLRHIQTFVFPDSWYQA